MGVWRDIIAGAVGGVIAAGAMSVAHTALAGIVSGPRQPPPAEERSQDATVEVADTITRLLLQRPLPEHSKPLAGSIVHYTFGGVVGALYGGIAAVEPRVAVGLGLPFGIAVWLGAHVIAVPALGLAAPPTRQPLAKEGLEFVMHLIYGSVTAGVHRLRRRRREIGPLRTGRSGRSRRP